MNRDLQLRVRRSVAWCAAAFVLTSLIPTSRAQTPYGFQFVRTDQDPSNVVYDKAHQRFLVSVPGTNTIYVVSEADGSVAGKVSIPAPTAMDLSPDGTLLYVVSQNSPYSGNDGFFVIETGTMKIVDFVEPVISAVLDPLVADASTRMVPSGIAALNNGKILYAASTKGITDQIILLYDPATGIARPRPPSELNPGGHLSRSADGSRVVILSPNNLVSLYDAARDEYIAQRLITDTAAWDAILSPDGTRVLLNGSRLFDQALNQTADLRPGAAISDFGGAVFSADGSTIYTNNTYYNSALPEALALFDSSTGVPIGYVPSLTGLAPHPAATLAVGVTGTAILLVNRGFAEVNVNERTAQLTGVAPLFLTYTPVSPPIGVSPNSGSVTIAQGYQPGTRVFFGGHEAGSVSGTPSSISAQPPPGGSGPVSVAVSYPDGWAAYSPEAYTYNPVVLFQDVNEGPTDGGTTVHIIGYGFDDASFFAGISRTYAHVSVGGAPATVTEEILGRQYFPYPFPLEHLTITTPAGVPGPADIVITTGNGTATVKGGFRYLSQQFVPGVLPVQMVLDETRGKLYVSDYVSGDVKAIDLNTLAVATLLPAGSDPAAGLALTPDDETLLVTSPSGLFTVLDLGAGAVVRRFTPTVPGARISAFRDAVVATSRGTALIGLATDLFPAGYFEVDLQTGYAAFINGANWFDSPIFASSADGSTVYLANRHADINGTHFYIWRAANDAIVWTRGFSGTSADISTTANGDRFLSDGNTYTANLLQISSISVNDLFTFRPWAVPGSKLHSNGSLEYLPTATGVEIHDTAHGTELLSIGFPGGTAVTEAPLLVNGEGRVIYVAEATGIGIIDLGKAPLSIGAVRPASGNANGGSQVTLAGSGFKAGATVAIDGRSVPVEVVSSTVITFVLPAISAKKVPITVTNPDGETYTLDAAYDASTKPAGPKPAITGIQIPPNYLTVPGHELRFLVDGSGFTACSRVQLDGLEVQTTYLSTTEIQGTAYALPSVADWIVTVTNPSPGGGTSNPFWLVQPRTPICQPLKSGTDSVSCGPRIPPPRHLTR